MSSRVVNPDHMNLDQIQRAVFEVVRQPLTDDERMRPLTLDGKSTAEIAEKVIKPNDRLSSVERLEIYNRVYWFRILSSLADDFPGLRAVVGQEKFDKILLAYLTELPSESFTLRNLGSRLETWLRQHPEFTPGQERIALDMVRLEWADIDAYDAAEFPKLTQAELQALGGDPAFHLQPNLFLLDLAYPMDEFLLQVRETEEPESDIASNVVMMDNSTIATLKLAPGNHDLFVRSNQADKPFHFPTVLQPGQTLCLEGKPSLTPSTLPGPAATPSCSIRCSTE